MNKETKPKLLVIPHVSTDDIKIRTIEFARKLTLDFDVYCLQWKDMIHADDPSVFKKRIKRLFYGLASIFQPFCTKKKSDGIIYIKAPYFQPLLLEKLLGVKTAWYLSRTFNSFILGIVCCLFKIDSILLSSLNFYLNTVQNLRKCFDMFDWFDEKSIPQKVLEDNLRHLSYLYQNVDKFFVVSGALSEKLKAEYNIEPVPIPNGVDLKLFYSVRRESITAVRKRWGLENKFVIGYIGNHGPYTGIDFVLKMFKELYRQMNDAVLFIVGPTDCWNKVIAKADLTNVVLTGLVDPKEMPAYFHAIDLGILAQEKSPGTEFAFQIKMAEYTACKKFVISTPLLVWKQLKWPNIILAEQNADEWINAIKQARNSKWQKEWDDIVIPYDWSVLSKKMAGYLNPK